MLWFTSRSPLLIGVVHLGATPGSPRFCGSLARVLERGCADARSLADGGCDAVIVENFGDAPFYPGSVPPETVASMALCVHAVIAALHPLPVGVNVLRNDARAALAVCATTGARFIRVNVHCGAAVTDQGIIEGRAHETLRERLRLAPDVAILADAHVKHATPLSRESLGQAVADLVGRGLADAVLVSGTATGRAPAPESVREACVAAGTVPVWIGSGLTPENAAALLEFASGAIVGTYFERDGAVDRVRVAQLRATLDALPRRV